MPNLIGFMKKFIVVTKKFHNCQRISHDKLLIIEKEKMYGKIKKRLIFLTTLDFDCRTHELIVCLNTGKETSQLPNEKECQI